MRSFFLVCTTTIIDDPLLISLQMHSGHTGTNSLSAMCMHIRSPNFNGLLLFFTWCTHLHLQILSSPEHHSLAMDICGLTPCFKRWWPSMLMHPWCWPDSSCAYLDSDQQDWFRLVKTGCNSCTPSIIIWVGYGYWSKFFNRMSFWHGQYLILGSDPRTEVKRAREIMPTQCI